MASKSTDLNVLQATAEKAASHLKGARTNLANAVQAVEKAEAAYAVAQKTFDAGVQQVKAATKVS